MDFKVDTVYTAYTIDIYRMGYYQGNGARKVATIAASAITPRMQPDCPPDTTTGLIDCSNWAISTTWQVPANAVSGIYFAKIEEVGNFHARNHIFFVVRNDASNSDLIYQTSDMTWQAYNDYGGYSLYDAPNTVGRAYQPPIRTARTR